MTPILLERYNNLPENEKENFILDQINNSDLMSWTAFPELTQTQALAYLETLQCSIEMEGLFMSPSKKSFEEIEPFIFYLISNLDLNETANAEKIADFYRILLMRNYYPTKNKFLNPISISLNEFQSSLKIVLKFHKTKIIYMDNPEAIIAFTNRAIIALEEYVKILQTYPENIEEKESEDNKVENNE